MSRLFRRTVTAVVIIVLSSGAGFRVVDASGQAPSQAAVANGLSPSGLAQLNALLAEKAALTPTQRKINSRLLHAKRQLTGETSVTTMNIALPLTAGAAVAPPGTPNARAPAARCHVPDGRTRSAQAGGTRRADRTTTSSSGAFS